MKVMREEQFQQVLGTMLMIQALFLLISFFLLRASHSWLIVAFGRFAYLFPLLLVLHGLSFAFSNALRQYRQLLLLIVQLLSISALGGAFALLRSSDTAHYAGVLGSIPSILIGTKHLKLVKIIVSLVPASLTLGLPYLKHVQSLMLLLQGSFHSLRATTSQRLKKVAMRQKSLEAGTIDSCLVHNEALPLSILPKHEANPLFSASRNSLSEACLEEMEMLIINIAVARAKLQIHRVAEKPPIIGMHVILFSFAPDAQSTVSVNRLSLLANDLGIALKRAPVHVQLTQYISIEVPLSEDERRFVSIGSLLHRCLETPEKGLYYLLGTSTKGDAYQLPVRGCYHMLVGGQTNSGKSVMLHTIIFGFIFRYPPSKVGLVLYDHKVEEFALYRNLPHLWAPVATNQTEFDGLLSRLEEEALRRKRRRSEDRKAVFQLLVVVMDEFRGLDSTRLISLISECRSLNMVFILATQYPRRDVISTPIKANLITSICFKTRDAQASRLIIGESGGERLMGKGDCLVHSPFSLDRVQGAYCTEDDLESVRNYLERRTDVQS